MDYNHSFNGKIYEGNIKNISVWLFFRIQQLSIYEYIYVSHVCITLTIFVVVLRI